MKDLKIITYNQNHDFLLELNGTSYWMSWQGVLLMDVHLVKIPEFCSNMLPYVLLEKLN